MSVFLDAGEVFCTSIWGGLYCTFPDEARPKRHVLYSNDERLLLYLETAAGHATGQQLQMMQGEPLTKKTKGPDGKPGFQGNGQAMKLSQYFGCRTGPS